MTDEKIVISTTLNIIAGEAVIGVLLSEAAFRAIQSHAGVFVVGGEPLEKGMIIMDKLEDYASGEPIEPKMREFWVTLPIKEFDEAMRGKRRVQYFVHCQAGRLEGRQDINVRLDSLMRTIMNLGD